MRWDEESENQKNRFVLRAVWGLRTPQDVPCCEEVNFTCLRSPNRKFSIGISFLTDSFHRSFLTVSVSSFYRFVSLPSIFLHHHLRHFHILRWHRHHGFLLHESFDVRCKPLINFHLQNPFSLFFQLLSFFFSYLTCFPWMLFVMQFLIHLIFFCTHSRLINFIRPLNSYYSSKIFLYLSCASIRNRTVSFIYFLQFFLF